MFSSFGFKWPVQLTKLFAASSMSSFNDQLMAPECSIGTWSFELKCVGHGAIRLGVSGSQTHSSDPDVEGRRLCASQ